MKSLLPLVAALSLCACLSSGPTQSTRTACVTVDWKSPKAKASGGTLPWMRVEGTGQCTSVRLVLRAFEDADLDGQPDEGGNSETNTIALSKQDGFVEFNNIGLQGDRPLRWTLTVESPDGDSVIDLGYVR
jgi:hypothetical protein